MQATNKARLAKVAGAAVLALSGGFFLACSDSAAPAVSSNDEWAAAMAIGVTVQSELSVLHRGQVVSRTNAESSGREPVIQGFGAEPATPKVAMARKGRRVVTRHFKRDSVIHSVAIAIGAKGTPDLVFAFENGRIRAIVSAQYEQHGRGFIRKRSKTTVFERGEPVAQVARSTSPSRTATLTHSATLLLGSVKAVADVLLPSQLHAQDGDLDCYSEYTSYYLASASLALASTALMAAAPACAAAPGPFNPVCLGAGAVFSGFVAALDRWNSALDNLIDCINMQELAKAKQPGGGTDHEDDDNTMPGSGTKTVQQVVDEFIEESIESNLYWCSRTGDYCVYYGEE